MSGAGIHVILNFSMIKFVKSFSKGQITVPKDIREALGLGDDFWLKLSVAGGKLIAEPVEKEPTISPAEYAKKLRKISGDWFSLDDYEKMRQEAEERLKRLWHE